MRKILKYFLRLLLLVLVAFVVFFFWASSPTLEESEYAKLTESEDIKLPENDSIFSIVTYKNLCILTNICKLWTHTLEIEYLNY